MLVQNVPEKSKMFRRQCLHVCDIYRLWVEGTDVARGEGADVARGEGADVARRADARNTRRA